MHMANEIFIFAIMRKEFTVQIGIKLSDLIDFLMKNSKYNHVSKLFFENIYDKMSCKRNYSVNVLPIYRNKGEKHQEGNVHQ